MLKYLLRYNILKALVAIAVLHACQQTPKQESTETNELEEIATTFFIVRHAEKLLDGSTNPPLTKEGHERANNLVEELRDVELAAIYSTPYKRTKSTARPLSIEKNRSIQIHNPADHSGFLDDAKKKYSGGNILVVGHSNTVPKMLNHLSNTNKYEQLEDDEYDKLFVVKVSTSGESRVEVRTF